MNLIEMKRFLKKVKQKDILFTPHFYKRAKRRPISEGMIRKFLSKPEKLEKIERGKENRFKLWFKLSGKYSLVIITKTSSKSLNIISAWNSNKKWEKKLKL